MSAPLRVLYLVEGFTDIRFVVGLSRICDLTMAVAAGPYAQSGLRERVAASGISIRVDEIAGDRLAWQAASLRYAWQHARDFDVILAQEALRGALSANVAGALRRVPVVTCMGVAPVEYFRCRRERRQISAAKALLGEAAIRFLLRANGALAARSLAMGPYLTELARRYSGRSGMTLYYGVDTEVFRPASAEERLAIRARRGLPARRFVVFLSSRISHEKDPETVLRATAEARRCGLDAVLLNLGGGYQDFVRLAHALELPDVESWVLGRPAAHPMTEVSDYFRAADVMALASLAEGVGYSTLEALACGTPVVATAVGGMAVLLPGFARLTPRRDAHAMADELLWVAAHPEEARAQALRGREYVVREWNRAKAFSELKQVLEQVAAA